MKPICVTAQILSAPVWAKRIAGKYTVNPDNGCWEWTGSRDRNGYGIVRAKLGGRKRYTGAHRGSWIAHRGPILGNLTIDHLCSNKVCVNPFHLEPVTNAENIRRAAAGGDWLGRNKGKKQRPRAAVPKVPLEARQGCRKHGQSEGHWRNRPDGYTTWHCRTCNRQRDRSVKKSA